MSNTGVSFDKSLIQPSTMANASIAGIPLRINPNSVSLSYRIKMSQTQTVGGFVFQIYGVEWSDLVVTGQFGKGGWQAQIGFFNFVQGLVNTTVADQRFQGYPGNSVEPDGSFRFLFPLLSYDFQVFLKSYTSAEGESVEFFNENINPSWTLTFTIDNDNGKLTKVATDQYITRLQQGVGYDPNQYNNAGSSSGTSLGTDIQSFLTGFMNANTVSQALSATSGTSPSDSSSTTGSAATANMIGNAPAQQAFNYLVQQGLTKIQAAGFVGNWQYESGGAWATAVQPGGQGNGIAQWSFNDRWATCCQVSGTPHVLANAPGAPNLAQQLAFALSELKGPYASVLTQTQSNTDLAAVTTLIQDTYERPADLTASIAQRIADAQAALAAFGGP